MPLAQGNIQLMNRDSWDLILTLHSVTKTNYLCHSYNGRDNIHLLEHLHCHFCVVLILCSPRPSACVNSSGYHTNIGRKKSGGIAVITSITDNPPKALAVALHRIYKDISRNLCNHVLIHQLLISFSCFSCLPQINTLPLLPVNASTQLFIN